MSATTPYICNEVSIRPVSHSANRMNVPTIIIPGRRKPCAARTRTKIIKKRARADVVTIKGKSHGIPRLSSAWTDINQAKIPRHTQEAARTMRIQILSWISGQR